jgi:hypothetical protein
VTTLFKFRAVLTLFIGLVLSGVTAFPLLHELRLLAWFVDAAGLPLDSGLSLWIHRVHNGLEDMYGTYPWIAYGTDWLAFGHLVIALFFIPPLLDPASSRPNLLVGVAACLLIFPLALICGPLRGIPWFWQLIDCSFGLFGVIPLWYCLRLQKQLVEGK